MRKLLQAASLAALVSLAAVPVLAQDQGTDPCALLSGLKDSGKDASDLFSQCISKSKEVELDPGIYSFDKPVSVSANGVAISTKGRSPDSAPCSAQLGVRCAVFAPGAGFSASGKPALEKGKSASPALVRVTGKYVALHHLEFDGMAIPSTKQSGSLLSIGSGAAGTTVLASEFRNWNGDAALSVVGAKNVSVVGSRFRSNGSQASLTTHINVKGGSGVKLSQNLLQDSSKFGINMSGCADCEAQGNVLWQSGSGKAGAIVALRAVGDTLTVGYNYVDCGVFWCNAAYFFGKSGEKAASNGTEASTITARSNVASHALAGFFFGLGSTIKADDNLALAQAGGFSCGKRASAPFSKLTGASVEAQGRAPAIVEASFSAKGLTEQERSKCVVGTAEVPRATGDEKALRAVAQTVFPFLLGRSPTKDERSATASQLAAGASLKDLFIGLDVLKSPEPASGEELTIMANKGGGKDPEGVGTQRADRGEKMGSSAVGGPTVTIASTTTSVASKDPIEATFRFSRKVTGFDVADITATNATLQAMTLTPSKGVGTIFTVRLVPTVATSDVTLAVAADKALGFDAPKIGNQASPAFTIPTAYARSTLRLSDSASGPFSGPRTICIQSSKEMPSPSFTCTNCTVSNFQSGCAPSTGSQINYSAIVKPSASANSVTVTIPEQLGIFVLASSNSLSWSVAPTPTPAPPTVFTAPRLFGTSTLKASTSSISIEQFHFGLRLPFARSGTSPNSWSIFVQSSASPPSSDLSVGGALYRWGSNGTPYIWPEPLGLSQRNRYLPCANLRLVPNFQNAPDGSPIYVSGCETLIAQNSAAPSSGRILRGLFNAPDGTDGTRPINVEYSVVNHANEFADISQQAFPPYTVAALNFNSAGAAQRDFQTNGASRCFDVKWRFSFSNGVYSSPETRRFCETGPVD